MIEIKDISQDFFAFWNESKDMGLDDKISLWESMYFEPNKEILELYFEKYSDMKYLNMMLERLNQYPDFVKNMEKTSREIESVIRQASLHVTKQFQSEGDLQISIVVLVGAGTSDAWVVNFMDKPTVFIALEYFVDSKRLGIALSHEMAHIIYNTSFSNKDINNSVVGKLVSEGIAIYTSSKCYPGFEESLYLYLNQDDIFDCESKKALLARYIAKNLCETDKEILLELFSGLKSKDGQFVERAGYWVGYHVIRQLAADFTITEIASWESERKLQEVSRILKDWED